MTSTIAVSGKVIRYYGTDYKIRSLVVDSDGNATVDLDPSSEKIVTAIQKVVKADSAHTIDFAKLEKELLSSAPSSQPGSPG